MELLIDEAMTPKKYLNFSDGSKEVINNITSRLKQGKAIRRSLKEWGRLHIDRLLPSYSFKRIGEDAPVFNVGTEQLLPKYRNEIQEWLSQLSKIKLPNIVNTTEENKVFFGRDYLANHVCSRSEDILVLPTEIKKIYCDEDSGEQYSDIINSITTGLKTAILNHSCMFSK